MGSDSASLILVSPIIIIQSPIKVTISDALAQNHLHTGSPLEQVYSLGFQAQL